MPWTAEDKVDANIPVLSSNICSAGVGKAATFPEVGWDYAGPGFAREVQNRGLMLKHLSLIAMAAGLVLAVGYAEQTTRVTIPVDKTSPTDGRQMFVSYCAPCHGAEGRGNGPAARALRTQPVDLTQLARNNHGRYPDAHVVSVLQFGSEFPSHGSIEMPVWGPILRKMNVSNAQERDLRMANLSRYLEHMQVK